MTQFLTLLAAITASVVIAAISVGILAAGGHGWTSSVISAVALLFGPLAAIAWLRRDSREGRNVGIAVCVLNLAADLLLVLATWREGWAVAFSAWRHAASFGTAWALLWVALQLLGAASLRRGRIAPASN